MAIFDLSGLEVAEVVVGELAVVLPVYNESEALDQVLQEWRGVLRGMKIAYVFVVVDDGSTDQTFLLLQRIEQREHDLVVVRKPNSGHGRSCRLGYDIASISQVEWVLQIDSDGQCDPVYFEEFWRQRSGFDCIYGVRRRRDDGWARAFTSQVCRWSASVVAGCDLMDPNVPYRLMKKNVLKSALERIPQGFDIHNMALTVVLKSFGGLRWKYVDIRFRDRRGGHNSLNLLGVAQLGFSMLFDLARLRSKLRMNQDRWG